jgi:dipeptidase
MDDSTYSSSRSWYIRMRFQPNANTMSYTSTTYAANGEIEFSNSGSESLSGDRYNSSGIAPTMFEAYQRRYVHDYY